MCIRDSPRRVAHGLGHFLRQIGFRKGLEGDDNLCAGFAQDRRYLFGFQQRVHRVDDARHRPRQQGDDGFHGVGQHIGHDIIFADAQRAEHVGGLGDMGVQLVPAVGQGFVAGAGQQLKAGGGAGAMRGAGHGQIVIDRRGNGALWPDGLGLHCGHVFARSESSHDVRPLSLIHI